MFRPRTKEGSVGRKKKAVTHHFDLVIVVIISINTVVWSFLPPSVLMQRSGRSVLSIISQDSLDNKPVQVHGLPWYRGSTGKHTAINTHSYTCSVINHVSHIVDKCKGPLTYQPQHTHTQAPAFSKSFSWKGENSYMSPFISAGRRRAIRYW